MNLNNKIVMPPWLPQLVSAQRKESRFNSSRWVQLATIGLDNTPRVRTVVFRGWTESYEMKIYTDKRSQKYNELVSNNNVEICWIFSRSNCQFRFRGNSEICLGKDNILCWEKLTEQSKSMWSWPSPGATYNIDKKNVISFKDKKQLSDNFSLLKINITDVDHLHLTKPMHMRRKWMLKKDWIEERINP